jgi:3-keto-disaccharide hydrolase
MGRRLALLLLAIVALASWGAADGDASKEDGNGWVAIFNGKNLDGWTPKIAGYALGDNVGNTFRVEDGVLKISYDQYDTFDGRFGHLFYKDTFSHYRMRLEYRFTGEQISGGPTWALRNSGIMIHGQSAESMGKDQKFPVSIEVQLLGGNGEDARPPGNLCTPGTHVEMDGEIVTRHVINSNSQTFHGDQWVAVEIEVRGDEVITHKINGETVLVYHRPQLDPTDGDAKRIRPDGSTALTGGTISLQSESHPVEFRNIEVQSLEE